MTTHAPVIENPICSKCKKQTKDMIYDYQINTHLCDSCLKAKFIDTITLIGEYAKSRERVKMEINHLGDCILQEKERLANLKRKYEFDEKNELLLKSRLKQMQAFLDELSFSFKEHLNEDTLIPTK